MKIKFTSILLGSIITIGAINLSFAQKPKLYLDKGGFIEREYFNFNPGTYFVNGRLRPHMGPQWIDMKQGSARPLDAVIGGGKQRNLFFICRGHFKNGLHPGRLTPHGTCNISFGGDEFSLTQYQLLVSRLALHWVPASFGYIPPHAIQGGYEPSGIRYICKAKYKGGHYPGKVIGQMCNIGVEGKEVLVPYYQVLAR